MKRGDVKVEDTDIPGLKLVTPRRFPDERGYLLEAYERRRYVLDGLDAGFVQDNVLHSRRGVLRGLHYQFPHPQGKLVQVLRGAVYDVVVDMRRDSPSFGRWFGLALAAETPRQVYLAPGLAHGFCVTSDEALVLIKYTEFYYPEHEHTLLWNDPALAIDWPIAQPTLSPKDAAGKPLAEAVRVG